MATLLGLHVTQDLPCPITDVMEGEAAARLKEIAGVGVEVTGIHIMGPEQPIRFFVRFVPGSMASTRLKLEGLRYDVGQQMFEKNLSFYVTKRLVQTKGWSE